MHAAQAALYEASGEVSRFEAEIKYILEGRSRVQAQIEQTKVQLSQWRERTEQLESDAAEMLLEKDMAVETHAALQEQLDMASEDLPELEARHRDALANMQSRREQYIQIEQKVAHAADEQRNADRQLNALAQRRERL